MRITLEVPDWVATSRILIIAGTELVAQKSPQDDFWLIKENRCARCAQCCLDNPPTPYGTDDEGRCLKLVHDHGVWECTAGMAKPLRCVQDPNIVDYEVCSITHRAVKA